MSGILEKELVILMQIDSSLLILLDFQIIMAIIFIIAAWRWGDWRNWKLYYPTILFFIVGNFSYTLLTYNYPLWQFESPLLKTTGSNFITILFAFSATILLFLPYYPKGKVKQIVYILIWVFIYTIIERVSLLLGFFSHHHGWSIWWSLLFNLFMFPLLWLHYNKPLLAWLISIIVAIIIIVYFKVPFSSMK